MFALLIALSTVVIGLFASTSMVWHGSPGLSAPVAVTSAVSSDNTGSIDTSLHHVRPGQGRDPPNAIDGLSHTYYVLAGDTPVLVHNCPPGSPARVSPAYQDWGTKGAHVHIGNHEVRIFPDGNGGIGAAPITLRTGPVTADDVASALNQIQTNPALRADLIRQAESAMASMNAGEWGMASNTAAEMHLLIVALKAMG